MTNEGRDIKNHKKRGEWAELQFMARAAEHGLSISKPWGESERYDIGVESNGQFLRVQVKCTMHRRFGSYACTLRKHDGGKRYTPGEIDFFAIYIVPEDLWYIVPAGLLMHLHSTVCLTPSAKGHKYERYLEAWELLRGKKKRRAAPSKSSGTRSAESAPPRRAKRLAGTPALRHPKAMQRTRNAGAPSGSYSLLGKHGPVGHSFTTKSASPPSPVSSKALRPLK